MEDNDKKRQKQCPLIDGPCRGERCGWYRPKAGECAIAVMAWMTGEGRVSA